MKLGKFMAVAVLAALLVPQVASATRLLSVSGEGNCEGWNVTAEVRFRSTVFAADLEFTLELLDIDMNVIETVTYNGVITRPDPSGQVHVFNFGEEWTAFAPAGVYMVAGSVTVSAPWSGGFDEHTEAFEGSFYCGFVPSEATSWSNVKGLYR